MTSKMPLVIFTPSGKRGNFAQGTTILSAAREIGVDLDSVCGGRGICSKCQVLPVFGKFPKLGIESDPKSISSLNAIELRYDSKRGLKKGGRLGCQAKILSSLVIDVPSESQIHKQVVRKNPSERKISMQPATKLYYVEVEKPDILNPSGDIERLKTALMDQWGFKKLKFSIEILKSVQYLLRKDSWRVTCAVHSSSKKSLSRVIKVWPGYFGGPIYSMAIDLGSTTVAAHLCDLDNGKVISSSGIMNPQIRFGEDLMSRVSYAMLNKSGTKSMSSAILEAINALIENMCRECSISRDLIFEAVIVANPVMHHIFLGINPLELGQAPFALATASSLEISAQQANLNINTDGRLYILPCIAGHVGADAAAVVLSEEPNKFDKTTLIVDVGTNAEILLGNKKRILACSSPTGPAFEGAQISCGQRAAPGAIEAVRIKSDMKKVKFKVVGCDLWSDEDGFAEAIKPIGITGICGSGIIEAIAEMRMVGILDESGLIGSASQTGYKQCISDGRTYSFILNEKQDNLPLIKVTNNDVRAIQLAKAALYAGSKLLMEKMGVKKIHKIILAGAFGAHISPKHAMVLGMIPDCNLKNVSSAGNAAGTGARIALLNLSSRQKIERLVLNIEKVETAMATKFQTHFVAASNIPNAADNFPELFKHLSLPTENFNRRGSKKRRRFSS